MDGTVVQHPELQMTEWLKKYPLDTLEEVGSSPYSICGIKGLSMAVQLQERYSTSLNGLKSVPVDFFMWRHGNPDKIYLTKIGGTPHRPADAPWPTYKTGKLFKEAKPMMFLLQYCFVDSATTLPFALPGQVMVVFVRDLDVFLDPEMEEGTHYHIEWWPIDIANPMPASAIPKTGIEIPKYHAEIFKTCQYPESPSVLMQRKIERTHSNVAFYAGSLISSRANTGQYEMDGSTVCTFYNNIEALDDATPLDGTSKSGWDINMETLLIPHFVFLLVVTRDAAGNFQMQSYPT
jgi:hypothetical protein